jgi:hypothetical protein
MRLIRATARAACVACLLALAGGPPGLPTPTPTPDPTTTPHTPSPTSPDLRPTDAAGAEQAAPGSWLDPATRAELGRGYNRLYHAALGGTLERLQALAQGQVAGPDGVTPQALLPPGLKRELLDGFGRWGALPPLACILPSWLAGWLPSADPRSRLAPHRHTAAPNWQAGGQPERGLLPRLAPPLPERAGRHGGGAAGAQPDRRARAGAAGPPAKAGGRRPANVQPSCNHC